MDFPLKIRELVALIDKNKDKVANEQATKWALVIPFFKVLGYDITDPDEIIPEYTADVGDKKGEKVDFAIKKDGQAVLLIEVKNLKSIPDQKDIYQLKRYFGVENVSFAILTNGIRYQFFTDFDKKHIMDDLPFYTVKLDDSIRDSEIAILQLFSKSKFNIDQITLKALEIKYTREIKEYLEKQIAAPEEEFIKFFMKKIKFQGPFYKKLIEQFSPIVSRAFKLYANQLAKKPHQPGKSTITGGGIIGPEPPPRPNLRYQFWDQLLEYAKPKTDLHAKIKTSKYDWIGRRIHGLWFNYVVGQHQSRAELWIDNGKNTEAENKEIFDKLLAAKVEIEQIFGGPLEWRRMDGKKACSIRKQINLGGYLDEGNWPKIHEVMVNAMIRLYAALSPHIEYLKK